MRCSIARLSLVEVLSVQILSTCVSVTAGTLKQQCGLPFSCVIQPFAKAEGTDPSAERDLPPLEDVARCKKCFA